MSAKAPSETVSISSETNPGMWPSFLHKAGLTLARHHGVRQIRAYTDSELVVDQVNGVSAVRQEHLRALHAAATELIAHFQSVRLSWVPREMNAEADQLVRDALVDVA